ncbi:uncharacterized protein G2W53_021668 [Senna tora]|uniref:Uncharacterized protein n=1 Tax=Senna tora TaxID=362788 RepID=A0A834TLR1_9FABA|nr:uncharacterized protein G2W53_021668 [Senna tora]
MYKTYNSQCEAKKLVISVEKETVPEDGLEVQVQESDQIMSEAEIPYTIAVGNEIPVPVPARISED